MTMKHFVVRLASLALGATLLLPVSGWAQQDNNRIELFAGYSWLHPGGTVAQTPLGTGITAPNAPTIKLQDLKSGFGVDGTYRFNRWFGLKAAVNGHYSDPSDIHTFMAGPVFTLPLDRMNFFGEALGGIAHVSPANLSSSNGGTAALGGGIDLWLTNRIAWRVIQADYIYQSQSVSDIGRKGDFNGARLQGGIVFGFGSLQARAASAAACTVEPSEVIVGETISAKVAGSNFNPKHTLAYEWTGSGVSSKANAATIETKDLAPGSYSVTAKVSDPKDRHAVASCSAQFTVKPLPPKNPPVVHCSANQSSILPGTPVTVDCTCTSPDGVAVKVSNWTASAGTISPSENVATVNTDGVAPGTITVGATCADARGLSTPASTSIVVEVPAPKVDRKLEARLALHSVYFQTAKPTVKAPTVGLLKTQEKTLLTLASDFTKYREASPNAHLVLEGHADVRGTAEYNQALTERRVAIVKSFLVEHGVPESVIETKPLGAEQNLTAEQVKASVENDSELSPEEKARIQKNIRPIIWASNRRVDVTLKAEGMSETSVRKFPFNGADSLTLLGTSTEKKAPAAHKKAAKKK